MEHFCNFNNEIKLTIATRVHKNGLKGVRIFDQEKHKKTCFVSFTETRETKL